MPMNVLCPCPCPSSDRCQWVDGGGATNRDRNRVVCTIRKRGEGIRNQPNNQFKRQTVQLMTRGPGGGVENEEEQDLPDLEYSSRISRFRTHSRGKGVQSSGPNEMRTIQRSSGFGRSCRKPGKEGREGEKEVRVQGGRRTEQSVSHMVRSSRTSTQKNHRPSNEWSQGTPHAEREKKGTLTNAPTAVKNCDCIASLFVNPLRMRML